MAPIRPDQGSVVDNGDGRYTATINTQYAGKYDLHAYLVVAGGFVGHYYDDPYFDPASLAKRRVDASLNFNWDEGKVTTMGIDFVSVWWSGKIKVDSTNSYTFTLVFDDNARLFIDGVLLIDMFDRAPGAASASHTLEANVYHDVMIEYRDVTDNAHLKFYWESAGASVPYELVPTENMFYVDDISGSPYNYTVVAGAADASKTVAKGKGLYRATAGRENKFSIVSNDAFGNWRGDFNLGYGDKPAFHDSLLEDAVSLDGFVGVASLVEDNSGGGYGNSDVPVSVSYNSTTKLFDATYVPGKSGIYAMYVGLSSEQLPFYSDDVASLPQIFGSPFTVTVSPDVTFARQSDVYGGHGNCAVASGDPSNWDVNGVNADSWASWDAGDGCSGVNHGLAGVEQTFFINSRDSNHNNRSAFADDDKWEVIAHSLEHNVAYEGTVERHSMSGQHLARITPKVSGRYLLDVTLNDAHALGSPFELYVRHNVAHGPTCEIVDPQGLKQYLKAYTHPTVNSYYVQLKDLEGNKLVRTDYPYVPSVSVHVTSDAANNVKDADGNVFFVGDGTFRFEYNPTVVGQNKLNIIVNGMHISGSPFAITSEATVGSVKGSQSTVTGAALTAGTAGVEESFVIQSRDVNGEPRSSDGDVFDVTLTMQTVSTRPPDLDTMVDDGWGSDATFTGTQTYMSDGQYRAAYNATVSGTYSLSIQEQGSAEHVSGSPFTLVISPGAASATESDVPGEGTRTGKSGIANVIRVHARDVFGNYLLKGGDKVGVRAELKSHHQADWEKVAGAGGYSTPGVPSGDLIGDVADFYSVSVPVFDNNDGSYTCDFNPVYAGTYDVTAVFETPGGLWGSYYSSDDFSPSKMSLTRHDLDINFDWKLYSPVSGGNHPNIRCVTSTGRPDDPSTSHFDESKCFGNGLALPADFFSVIWSGFIETAHDEEHEFGLTCDEGSQGGVKIDGVDVIEFENCMGANGMLTGKVVMSSTSRASIEVKYRHKDEHSNVALLWRSETRGDWSTVGRESLFRDIIASATVYKPTYAPNSPSSRRSTATGESVTKAVAGVNQQFTLECRDDFGAGAYGNLQLAGGGCNVAAIARGASAITRSETFEGTVADNGDGTYTVTYNPVHSGTYYFSITAAADGAHEDVGHYYMDMGMRNLHVAGSPFILEVEPGQTASNVSHIDEGYVEDAIVGVESNVTIWAKDRRDNRRLTGGDEFEIFLALAAHGDTHGHADGDRNVYGNVEDNQDGTYTGTFAPGQESGNIGTYKLHVVLVLRDDDGNLLGREECLGSPYDITIWPSTPYGGETHVSSGWSSKTLVTAAPGGEINKFAMAANSLRSFYIQASDSHGNDWWVGGVNFVARIRGETNEQEDRTKLAVADQGNGKYKVDCELSVAGTYEIDIGIAGYSVDLSKFGRQVRRDNGGFGLMGKYFSNQHLLGAPSLVRVDKTIDFNWGHGLVTKSAIDFVSIEWTG